MKPRAVRGAISAAVLIMLTEQRMTTFEIAKRMCRTVQYIGMVISRMKKWGWVSGSWDGYEEEKKRSCMTWHITDAGSLALSLRSGETSDAETMALGTGTHHGPETMEIDGEKWARCKHCVKRGYGADAWFPVTSEFFRDIGRGSLLMTQCKACHAETKLGHKGFLPEDFELSSKAA